MKSSFKRSFKTWHWVTICVSVVSIVGFVSSLRSQAMAPAYTITDLGTLGGSPNQSRGYGINNCGTTVGDSLPAATPVVHPFYKKGATMTDIGSLGAEGTAYSLNAQGYTVGYSSSSIGQRAILWHDNDGDGVSDPGELQDFLPAGATGVAYEVNDSNNVVGAMDASGGSNLSDSPFVWNATSGFQSLPTPPAGMSPTRAQGINNAGTITGWAIVSLPPFAPTHAFVLKNNSYIDLGTLDNTTLSLSSFSWRISEDGHVVGYSQTPSNNASIPFHPFVWFDANSNNTSDAGEMKDLGALPGDTNGYAYDINASGYVVGTSELILPGPPTTIVHRAFVWHDDNANGVNDPGEMKDLNGEFSDATWTTLVEARAINDGGQIVGWGTKSNGETHAFLLTPAGFTPPACPGATPSPSPTPTPSPTYSVSGQVKDAANMPTSGVLITFEMNFQGTPSTTSTLTDASGNYSSGDLGCKNNVKVTPSKAGFSFNPLSTVFVSSGCLSGMDTANFTATIAEPAPVILLETGTNNAAAVDSVTFVRGPFSVTDNFNFSGDHITRIIIFTAPLSNPDSTLKVFASGHELPVESFGSVTGVPGLSASYIVVKLDPVLTGSGPINYDLAVSLRSVMSNTATLTIIP